MEPPKAIPPLISVPTPPRIPQEPLDCADTTPAIIKTIHAMEIILNNFISNPPFKCPADIKMILKDQSKLSKENRCQNKL